MKITDAIQAATLNGSFEVFQTSRDWWKVRFNPVNGKVSRPAVTEKELAEDNWEPVVPDPEVTQKVTMLRGITETARVWINRGYGSRTDRDEIHTVKRVTPTQIVLEPGGEFDRYDRFTGYRKGGGMNQPSIVAIATKADAERWDAKRVSDKQKKEADRAADSAFETLRSELRGLFPEIAHTSVYIAGNRRKNEFSIEMHGLSQAQVKQIAKVLSEVNKFTN